MCVCVLVAESCLTLCKPRDCSPPGASTHRLLQARILEWVAIPFSRGSSPPKDQTHVSVSSALLADYLPGGSDGKQSVCNAGDLGSIPGSRRPFGEANGYPLQYSCLEKSMDRRVCQATFHGVTKSWTHLRTNTFTSFHFLY